MTVGGPELLILFGFGIFALVPLVLGILVAIDASRFPDAAFDAAGTSKVLWIVLPLVGILVCGVVTIVAAIVWYSTYRPRVQTEGGAIQ
jgi:hypothetical protein